MLRLWASYALSCCYEVLPIFSLSAKYVSLFYSPLQYTEENSYIIHPAVESEHLFSGRLHWVLKDYTITSSNYEVLITQFLRYYSHVTPQEAKLLTYYGSLQHRKPSITHESQKRRLGVDLLRNIHSPCTLNHITITLSNIGLSFKSQTTLVSEILATLK